MGTSISQDQIDAFHQNGYLVLRSFYDESEILPIWQGIYDVIGILIRKYDLPIERAPFSPHTFDDGFQDLISVNRSWGGEVYDAVKQLPSFVRLSCSEKHDLVFKHLRGESIPGYALGGSGIRIDNPNEEKFRAEWHQDYPAQLRSLDGLVFWSPLIPITPDLGPVQVCPTSHKDGLVKVQTSDPANPEKKGAYGLVFANGPEIVGKYRFEEPLLSPTDLLVIDFLLVHRSGRNVSSRSRWSLQMRYFNFLDARGIDIGWAGSFAAGTEVSKIHPDLVVGEMRS